MISQYQHGNVVFLSNYEFCFKLLLRKYVKLFILAKIKNVLTSKYLNCWAK